MNIGVYHYDGGDPYNNHLFFTNIELDLND